MFKLFAGWGAFLMMMSASADELPDTQGFHNESEAGVVLTSGNTESRSFNLKHINTYGWESNLAKFNARYFKTSTRGIETAHYWSFGLRFERELTQRFSAFVGQTIESDFFAGYSQRYNTDVGGKYYFFRDPGFSGLGEAGYRYSIENRFTGQVKLNYLRFYTEANREWTKTFSSRLWVEYLPNLTQSSDYQLNAEPSITSMINGNFSIKAGYLIRYRNILIKPATHNTDTQFTTALVARF